MSSAEKLIDVLGLFTLKRPTWTPDGVARVLGLSRASTYRYFSRLRDAGYIDEAPGHRHHYVLGPKIIELDRQVRLSDPLIQVAVDEMVSLARQTGGVVLLCRYYNRQVLCIHQERGLAQAGFVSYERGRPIPLYRGATSKVILALLSPRELEILLKDDRTKLIGAGLPRDVAALRERFHAIREQRFYIAYGEVDPGRCGMAVPICRGEQVLGSLSIVVQAAAAQERFVRRISRLLIQAGLRIESELDGRATAVKPKRASTGRKHDTY